MIPAWWLFGNPGVHLQYGPFVDYIHFMCDGHEIVWSNGVLSESFVPTKNALNAMKASVRNELHALFPETLKRFAAGSETPLPRMPDGFHKSQLTLWQATYEEC